LALRTLTANGRKLVAIAAQLTELARRYVKKIKLVRPNRSDAKSHLDDTNPLKPEVFGIFYP
jgi:hypothetical protein